MKTNRKTLKSKTGFTIVELLTVMSVIAILITLLVPALTLVRDFAKEIQQKAQFHSIEVGVEMFKTEFGSYPESKDNSDLYDSTKNHPDDVTPYGGANKLAEAMVGQDLLGFHSNSDFRSDGRNWRNANNASDPTAEEQYDVYHADADDFSNDLFRESAVENVQARKGPFLDLENANAFTMEDVYGASLVNFDVDSFILCDEYVAKREGAKKTGMPILYYRARKIHTQQDSTDALDIADDIYYYPDNQNLLDLGTPGDGDDHPLSDLLPAGITDDYLDFDNMIINTQITQIKRPYRADSYILISAGKDGLYGTPDDLFNFEKE